MKIMNRSVWSSSTTIQRRLTSARPPPPPRLASTMNRYKVISRYDGVTRRELSVLGARDGLGLGLVRDRATEKYQPYEQQQQQQQQQHEDHHFHHHYHHHEDYQQHEEQCYHLPQHYHSNSNAVIRTPEVESFYAMMSGNNIFEYNSLKEALRQYRRLKEEISFQPSVSVFNALIESCHKHNLFEQASNIYEDLLKSKKQPNNATFNSFISAYGRAGNMDKALEWYGYMKKHNVDPDLLIYSTLIHVCGMNNRISTAVEFLSEMKSKGFKPNEVIYSSIIDAFGKQLQYDEAVFYLQEMVAQGLSPNRVTYTSLITLCGKVNRAPQAIKLFEDFKGSGEIPDPHLMVSLIKACVECKREELALNYVEEIKKTTPELLEPPLYNAILVGYKKNGDFSKALELKERMKRDGIKPDKITYLILIGIAKKLQKLDTAVQLVEEMKREKVPLTVEIMNELISTAGKCRRPDLAKRFFAQIQESTGCAPDSGSYNTIISALNAARMYEEAEKIYEVVPENKKNLFLDTSRLKTLTKNYPARVERHWEKMKKMYPELSPVAYTNLLHWYMKYDQREKVLQTLNEMKALGYPLTAESIKLLQYNRYSAIQ